jgi:hypothetical protein
MQLRVLEEAVSTQRHASQEEDDRSRLAADLDALDDMLASAEVPLPCPKMPGRTVRARATPPRHACASCMSEIPVDALRIEKHVRES